MHELSAGAGRSLTADPLGLTEQQVAQRRAEGLSNEAADGASRTVRDIIRANVLTRFNAILGYEFVQ